jgi:hypothetical protein
MALAHATVFEVRTAGSDSNGGGFVTGSTGTDFSQQNAAQYTFTDLASTSGTTNPSIVTSASHSFGATDVGNIMQITAGTSWLTGFYQIVSVSAGAATLDRACGSAASITAGTYAVGGALLTWSILSNASLTAGNIIYIKSGTYTITSTISLGASGNDTNGPISVIGYDVSRGDNDGTRPILTSATTTVNLIALNGKFTWSFTNFKLTHTGATRGAGFIASTANASIMTFTNFIIDGCLNGFQCASLVSGFGMFQACIQNFQIQNCTNDGIELSNNGQGAASIVRDGTIFNCTTSGFDSGASNTTSVILERVLISSNGKGVNLRSIVNGMYSFLHCDIYKNTGDGIAAAGVAGNGNGYMFENNIIYGNGGFGINFTNTSPNVFIDRTNAFGSNTSGNANNYTLNSTDLTGIADPLTSTTNPTLSSTSVCKAAGFPGVFLSGGTGFPDIGILQHKDSDMVIAMMPTAPPYLAYLQVG